MVRVLARELQGSGSNSFGLDSRLRGKLRSAGSNSLKLVVDPSSSESNTLHARELEHSFISVSYSTNSRRRRWRMTRNPCNGDIV